MVKSVVRKIREVQIKNPKAVKITTRPRESEVAKLERFRKEILSAPLSAFQVSDLPLLARLLDLSPFFPREEMISLHKRLKEWEKSQIAVKDALY